MRAAARNRKVLEAREWAGVELVQADALDPATLPAALEGVAVAYYLVHSMAAGRDFGRLDLRGGACSSPQPRPQPASRASSTSAAWCRRRPTPSTWSRARETGESCAPGRCRSPRLRAGIIVGAGSAAYEVIRDLVNHLPLMVTPRWVKSKSSPIALDNLLEYLLRAAADRRGRGRHLRRRRAASTCRTKR